MVLDSLVSSDNQTFDFLQSAANGAVDRNVTGHNALSHLSDKTSALETKLCEVSKGSVVTARENLYLYF